MPPMPDAETAPAAPRGTTMPVMFYGHGSPTIVRETNAVTRQWRDFAESAPRPSAILAVSAHWVTPQTRVTAMAQPRTIHDFGRGLGVDLFEHRYPAPGSPALADRVRTLLAPDIDTELDEQWGLDHGTWSVLLKAFPAADIPVVQLSIAGDTPSERHIAIGARLQTLRHEGVLIVATGNIVHNLSLMDWDEAAPSYDWATAFNETIKAAVANRDGPVLADPYALGTVAALSLPTAEHYMPLLYAYGASTADDRITFAPDFVQYRSLSMTSIRWG